ncbi:hypothetical protein L903_21880 [Agrobacterium sp. JL28]|nr:hypothetical protein L904_21865 [Agrobacterium sp. LY4]KVK48854.1 hypothetical protein L903_21880 [Agrobacterium sp. JL28]
MRPSACTAAREIFALSRLAVMKLFASFSIATIASMVPVVLERQNVVMI